MKSVKPLLATSATILLIVGSGIVHGLQTDRWGLPANVSGAASRLSNVAGTLGDWYSEEIPIGERQLHQAEAIGHLSRRYVNRSNGATVNVLVLCGRPGPISVHPPTVCFVGSGWALEHPEERVMLTFNDGTPMGEFWQGDFTKYADGVPMRMRTLWTWSVDGDWQAPANPRLDFAAKPYLYKMYITFELLDDADAAKQSENIKEFLELFLRELDRRVFSKQT